MNEVERHIDDNESDIEDFDKNLVVVNWHNNDSNRNVDGDNIFNIPEQKITF